MSSSIDDVLGEIRHILIDAASVGPATDPEEDRNLREMIDRLRPLWWSVVVKAHQAGAPADALQWVKKWHEFFANLSMTLQLAAAGEYHGAVVLLNLATEAAEELNASDQVPRELTHDTWIASVLRAICGTSARPEPPEAS
jgi:hypothetical protein